MSYICSIKLEAPFILNAMKKLTTKFFTLLFTSLLLTSCGGEDLDDKTNSSFSGPIVTANIEYTQLVGKWDLIEMRTETLVDLNNDNIGSLNLLSETSCFDEMSITFYEDMTFSSVNARMDFAAGDSNTDFACIGTGRGPDTGTWEISGDILTLTVIIDGQSFTNTKQLTFSPTQFRFDVSELESQQYVSDPGGTAISDVTIVYLGYEKA